MPSITPQYGEVNAVHIKTDMHKVEFPHWGTSMIAINRERASKRASERTNELFLLTRVME